MKSNIQTDLEKVYTKFSVDDSVTEWLKSSLEIIFDITQVAVQNNRFEVVDSGLKNIVDIAKEYVAARLDYSTEQDIFIGYLDERLIDIKNLVQKNTHPKIMLSISRAAKDIAIATLQIKPIRTFAGENFIPLGFINLLSSICLSPEILKETSYAPMSTIDYLVEIAKDAMDRDFPRTVTLITDKLGNIATITTKLHFLYADSIAEKANWGLASIFDYMLSKQDKFTLYVEHEEKSILEQIDASITTYIEDDIKYHYATRSNIKTFFGPLAEHGLASVFIKLLQKKTDERFLSLTLKTLEDFLIKINQNIMKGMNNSKYLDVKDILEHIYLIGFVFTEFSKKKKDPRFQTETLSLLQNRFYLPFINAISMSFKQDTNRYTIFDDDYIHAFFSLMGVIFYENEKHLFDQVLEDWTNHVIKIIQEFKTQTTIEHEGHIFEKHEVTSLLRDLYKQLRLVGVWFNHFIPKSETLKEIIVELKSQPDITIPRNEYGEDNLYPIDFMAQRWIILRPYLPFDARYFSNLESTLCNKKIITEFETKLNDKKKVTGQN